MIVDKTLDRLTTPSPIYQPLVSALSAVLPPVTRSPSLAATTQSSDDKHSTASSLPLSKRTLTHSSSTDSTLVAHPQVTVSVPIQTEPRSPAAIADLRPLLHPTPRSTTPSPFTPYFMPTTSGTSTSTPIPALPEERTPTAASRPSRSPGLRAHQEGDVRTLPAEGSLVFICCCWFRVNTLLPQCRLTCWNSMHEISTRVRPCCSSSPSARCLPFSVSTKYTTHVILLVVIVC